MDRARQRRGAGRARCGGPPPRAASRARGLRLESRRGRVRGVRGRVRVRARAAVDEPRDERLGRREVPPHGAVERRAADGSAAARGHVVRGEAGAVLLRAPRVQRGRGVPHGHERGVRPQRCTRGLLRNARRGRVLAVRVDYPGPRLLAATRRRTRRVLRRVRRERRDNRAVCARPTPPQPRRGVGAGGVQSEPLGLSPDSVRAVVAVLVGLVGHPLRRRRDAPGVPAVLVREGRHARPHRDDRLPRAVGGAGVRLRAGAGDRSQAPRRAAVRRARCGRGLLRRDEHVVAAERRRDGVAGGRLRRPAPGDARAGPRRRTPPSRRTRLSRVAPFAGARGSVADRARSGRRGRRRRRRIRARVAVPARERPAERGHRAVPAAHDRCGRAAHLRRAARTVRDVPVHAALRRRRQRRDGRGESTRGCRARRRCRRTRR